MADNVNITPGTGAIIAADEITDATLGTASVQYVKTMDGALDGTAKLRVVTNNENFTDATDTGILPMAVANETPEIRIPGKMYPLSVSSDGRLRVVSMPSNSNYDFWGGDISFGDSTNWFEDVYVRDV